MQLDACNPSAEVIALALAAFGLVCLLASGWLNSALKQRKLVHQLRDMENNVEMWRHKHETELMWRGIIESPPEQVLLPGSDGTKNTQG